MTRPTLRRPADVGVVEAPGVVIVARLPQGPMQALTGASGIIWQEAVLGDREGVAARVAQRTDTSAAEIRPHVDAFVEDLIRRGVLEETSEGVSPE